MPLKVLQDDHLASSFGTRARLNCPFEKEESDNNCSIDKQSNDGVGNAALELRQSPEVGVQTLKSYQSKPVSHFQSFVRVTKPLVSRYSDQKMEFCKSDCLRTLLVPPGKGSRSSAKWNLDKGHSESV